MASQQDPRVREDVRGKELRAEEAARAAADELRDVNKQRGVSGGASEVLVEHQESRPADENRPGIIGSIFQTVTGTLGSAKDVVTGKTHEATDKATVVSRQNKQTAAHKAGEYKDYTAKKAGEAADKTGEYKDYTAQKAKETADSAAQKTKEAKDATIEKSKEAADATARKAKEAKDYSFDKTKEAKDYTVDKSKQGKDSAVGKLSELKDKAIDFFSGKKEETKEKMISDQSGGFRKGMSNENEEEARRKLETMRLKDEGYEAKGTSMDTTTEGGGESVVAEVDRVRDTAEAFRKADQITGQSFNDVGVMVDDRDKDRGGVYRVQLKHEKK